MSRLPTGASARYGGAPGAVTPDDGRSSPGLVLLYAPGFEALLPAYPLTAPETLLGREAECAICVPDQAVSRQHARIVRDAGADGTVRWVLTDLESRNGTMVDGAYVQSIELEHLHEVRIGDALFKFVESDAERFVPYRIDGEVNGQRRPPRLEGLVGGAQIDCIAQDLERVAKTALSCVVLGETGTGKEVAARALHGASGRRGSFQAINCAAIPHALLESELFGYRRGAFSGADRDKPGLVKLADGGTLFLDEIGDMPLEAQAKLLRVLQSREVFPLGGTTAESVDLRVVCATHRDVAADVREGRFRADLYARLNEHVVRLPPLRERKEDVHRLARVFAERHGGAAAELSFSFLVALLHYDWPYNVRELESCMKRAVALSAGTLDTPQLPEAIAEHMRDYGKAPRASRREPGTSELPPPASASAIAHATPPRRLPPSERELRALLEEHQGNVAAVGRVFGKERMQVHRWLKRYGIRLEEYR
jgi:transcriptional regulator with GAF, ATPase, and Fis domain